MLLNPKTTYYDMPRKRFTTLLPIRVDLFVTKDFEDCNYPKTDEVDRSKALMDTGLLST